MPIVDNPMIAAEIEFKPKPSLDGPYWEEEKEATNGDLYKMRMY